MDCMESTEHKQSTVVGIRMAFIEIERRERSRKWVPELTYGYICNAAHASTRYAFIDIIGIIARTSNGRTDCNRNEREHAPIISTLLQLFFAVFCVPCAARLYNQIELLHYYLSFCIDSWIRLFLFAKWGSILKWLHSFRWCAVGRRWWWKKFE